MTKKEALFVRLVAYPAVFMLIALVWLLVFFIDWDAIARTYQEIKQAGW